MSADVEQVSDARPKRVRNKPDIYLPSKRRIKPTHSPGSAKKAPRRPTKAKGGQSQAIKNTNHVNHRGAAGTAAGSEAKKPSLKLPLSAQVKKARKRSVSAVETPTKVKTPRKRLKSRGGKREAPAAPVVPVIRSRRERKQRQTFEDEQLFFRVLEESKKEFRRQERIIKYTKALSLAKASKATPPSRVPRGGSVPCPGCGRKFKVLQGVSAHLKYCRMRHTVKGLPCGRPRGRRMEFTEAAEIAVEIDSDLSCDEDYVDGQLVYSYAVYPVKGMGPRPTKEAQKQEVDQKESKTTSDESSSASKDESKKINEEESSPASKEQKRPPERIAT